MSLFMSPLFGDYAVFPKGLPICVFGESNGEGEVVLTLENGEERAARFAPQDGKFSVLLAPVDRYAEEAKLTVKTSDAVYTASHVSIGIVLLASGQSNMQFTLTEAERPKSLYPSSRMRFFTEKHALVARGVEGCRPVSDFWYTADGSKELNFSAIGYFAAEMLSSELGVTVGVISSNQGASCIEAWLSPEAEKRSGAIPCPNRLEMKEDRPFNFDHWLYYNKYLPVSSYTFSGVLWYQGESNTDFDTAPAYEKYLHALIAEWRENNPNHALPFYLVELCAFDSVKAGWAPEPLGDWAPIREVLVRASLHEENVYTVSLTEVENVAEIHPTNKYPVAEKLVRAFLSTQCGYSLEYRGPLFVSASRKGDTLTLSFAHADGLCLREGDTALSDAYFEMEDGSLVPADAVLENEKLILSVPRGAVAFEMGYKNVPEHNLYNSAGFLASPCRVCL